MSESCRPELYNPPLSADDYGVVYEISLANLGKIVVPETVNTADLINTLVCIDDKKRTEVLALETPNRFNEEERLEHLAKAAKLAGYRSAIKDVVLLLNIDDSEKE